MLELPIHRWVRFVFVTPHYPENIGAAARAIKTMGFTQMGLVKPSRLAMPDHPMAKKMAVKSNDVLERCALYDNLDEALVGSDMVVATTSRRGVSHIVGPRHLARFLLQDTSQRRRACILFGNEKTGLSAAEVRSADTILRIPMAADQPSINLAQCAQLVAYELFQCALEERERLREEAPGS